MADATPQVGDEITVVGPGSPHNGERYKVLAIDRNRMHVKSPSSGKEFRFPRAGRFRFKIEYPPETAANERQRMSVEEVVTDEPEVDEVPEAPDQLDDAAAAQFAAMQAQERAKRRSQRQAISPAQTLPALQGSDDLAQVEANIIAQIARLQGQLEGIQLCRQALSRSS